MRSALRVLLWLTYPFLVLSSVLIGGTLFRTAFIADFTIENRTGQAITVTPVGTVGKEGKRAPLPTVMGASLSLPAIRAGGFPLAPGRSLALLYDMDDINFSEIVIEDGQGRRYQFIVNPEPTTNQYHAPRERQFVIGDLQRLGRVEPGVAEAAQQAQGIQWGALIMNALLIAPWLVYGALRFAIARRRPGANTPTGIQAG